MTRRVWAACWTAAPRPRSPRSCGSASAPSPSVTAGRGRGPAGGPPPSPATACPCPAPGRAPPAPTATPGTPWSGGLRSGGHSVLCAASAAAARAGPGRRRPPGSAGTRRATSWSGHAGRWARCRLTVTCHVSRVMCRCWASSGASAAATSCRCPAGRRSCSTPAPTAGSCPPNATTAGAARAVGPSPGWTPTHGTRTGQNIYTMQKNICSIPRSLSTWVAVGDVDEVNSQLPSPHVEMIKVRGSFIIQTNPNCCKLQVINKLQSVIWISELLIINNWFMDSEVKFFIASIP